MAIAESTTGPEHNAEPATFDKGSPTSTLEAAIEAERTRLMVADSVLGCLQIALDPQAVKVLPAPNFPEVVGVAREHVNETIRHLERFRGLIASASPSPIRLR